MCESAVVCRYAGCGVRYLCVNYHIRCCILNHCVRTLLVALLCSVTHVENHVVALLFALFYCVWRPVALCGTAWRLFVRKSEVVSVLG
jgi:hypothetical protein